MLCCVNTDRVLNGEASLGGWGLRDDVVKEWEGVVMVDSFLG